MTKEEVVKKKRKDFFQPFRNLRARWHDNHTAYRDTLDFDSERVRYVLNRETIVQSDIVPVDLQVDGDRWRVFRTPLELPSVPDTRVEVDENGVEHVYLNPTPISYNLYNESDALNEAATGEFRAKIINPMVLAIVIGLGVLFLIMMIL